MSWQLIVEPGIELRQFEPRDAEPLLAAVERNRAYLREWLPWVDQTQSARDILHFFERVRQQFIEGRGPNAGIWIDGDLRGSIGCHAIEWANWNCSIGYWLDATLQGRGLVTLCCAVFLDYLFDDVGLHRVTIQCGTGNHRSCAIPKRLGFEREGVMRQAEWVNDRWVDLVVWGMLADDWRRLRHTARRE